MAPVLTKDWLKKLAVPIDFNLKLKGKPVFGKNKTLRGFLFAVLYSIVIAMIQNLLFNSSESFRTISLLDYSNWLLFGFLIGFGAITGDLIKSFFKRRLDIPAGARFFPWDQLDFVIGALIVVSLVYKLTLVMIITIILISIVLHIIVNHVGFYLKLRTTKW